MKHEDLTERIIGIFYRVYNTLGYGFLEKIYENALAFEFERAGLNFGQQVSIRVLYEGEIMGEYFADFIIEGKIIVEVKADKFLGNDGEKQLLNYLRATDKDVGLLLGFGKKAEVRRKIFERARGEGNIGTRMNAG